MESIYQLIFFLSIALLAIVVTVFVLAVSLLGRAVRLSVEEQTQAEEKRKQDTENEIKEIQGKLDQAKTQGRLDVGDLVKNLNDLERKEAKHKWKLRWIKIKPKLLTATWGALVPGAFFLISVIFSALALYLQGGRPTATLYIWIALIALGIGIVFICLTLKAIEGVAKTSDETALLREVDAFKTALREFEKEKKPELELAFREKLLLHMKPDSEKEFEILLKLTRGDEAVDTFLYLAAPPSFDFPGLKTHTQNANHPTIPNYITIVFPVGNIKRGINQPVEITLKAPTGKSTFSLYYRMVCTGFDSGENKVRIVVN